MKIEDALASLDTEDDELWTADRLPRVYAVSEAVGYDVTRKQITDANPAFIRPDPDAPESVVTLPEEEIETFRVQSESSEPAEEKPKDIQWPDQPSAPTADEVQEYVKTAREGNVRVACVVPLDEVVGLHPTQVYSSVDLVDRAVEEFGRQAEVLSARREAIDKQIKDVGRRGALLSKRRNRMPRGSEKSKQAETIKRYLKVQHESRAKRAETAQKYIEAGTTPEDVRKQLEIRSPLDAAMKHRKPSRSGTRPVYPPRAAGA
jgi:hypothetical protein